MAILRRLLLNSRLNSCLWMSLNVIWDICCLWQFLCNSFQYFSQFFDMSTKVRLGGDMNPLCGKHPVVAVVPSRMIWTEDRQVMHQINAAKKITGNLHHHNNYIINGLTPWCRRPLIMVLGTDRVACACAQGFSVHPVCMYIYIEIYIYIYTWKAGVRQGGHSRPETWGKRYMTRQLSSFETP
jgi:LSD1 subclass zinc finger protein